MSRIETLLKFLQEDPDDSFSSHALALEYVKTNRLLEAKNVWLNLLQKDPEYVGSYYHLGKLLEQLGEEQEAATCYRHGIEVATRQNAKHARTELQAALDEIDE